MELLDLHHAAFPLEGRGSTHGDFAGRAGSTSIGVATSKPDVETSDMRDSDWLELDAGEIEETEDGEEGAVRL